MKLNLTDFTSLIPTAASWLASALPTYKPFFAPQAFRARSCRSMRRLLMGGRRASCLLGNPAHWLLRPEGPTIASPQLLNPVLKERCNEL